MGQRHAAGEAPGHIPKGFGIKMLIEKVGNGRVGLSLSKLAKKTTRSSTSLTLLVGGFNPSEKY